MDREEYGNQLFQFANHFVFDDICRTERVKKFCFLMNHCFHGDDSFDLNWALMIIELPIAVSAGI